MTEAGIPLLVIEDDPDQRELISETLTDHFGAGVVELRGHDGAPVLPADHEIAAVS